MSQELAVEIGGLFLEFSAKKLEQMERQLRSCIERLSDAQVWQRGSEHENAVGNLVLHLCGNMRQWILHGVAKQPDVRERDAEFDAGGGMSGGDLVTLFAETTAAVCGVIRGVPVERLVERTNPQPTGNIGEVSVLDAIYQVVGHVELHAGQVILLTKQMVGTDLGLSMPRRRAVQS